MSTAGIIMLLLSIIFYSCTVQDCQGRVLKYQVNRDGDEQEQDQEQDQLQFEPAIVDTGMEFLINTNKAEKLQLDANEERDLLPAWQIPNRQERPQQQQPLDDLNEQMEAELARTMSRGFLDQQVKNSKRNLFDGDLDLGDQLDRTALPILTSGQSGQAPSDWEEDEIGSAPRSSRPRRQLLRQDAFDIPDEEDEEAELVRIRESVDRLIENKHQSKLSLARRQINSPDSMRFSPEEEGSRRGLTSDSSKQLLFLHPKTLEEARSLDISFHEPHLLTQPYLADDNENASTDDGVAEDNNVNLMETLAELDRLAAVNEAALRREKREESSYYEELLPREKLAPQMRFRRSMTASPNRMLESSARRQLIDDGHLVEQFLKSRSRLAIPADDEEQEEDEDGEDVLFDKEDLDAELGKEEETDPSIRARFKVCTMVKDKFHKQLAFTGKTLELDECYVTCERKEESRVFSHVFKLVDWPCGNRLEGKCLPDGSCSAFV